jgi:hypothetical protein
MLLPDFVYIYADVSHVQRDWMVKQQSIESDALFVSVTAVLYYY